MSRPQQNAVLQEVLDQGWWWRMWAALKHGLPTPPPRNVIKEDATPQPTASAVESLTRTETLASTSESQVQALAEPVSKAVDALGRVSVTVDDPKMPGWLKAALVTFGMGATGALGAGSAIMLSSNSTGPSQQVVVQPQDGALIPWLRDQGYNLPPPGEVKP